jgi:diketogulonate reductase-like aldo/keto reductase
MENCKTPQRSLGHWLSLNRYWKLAYLDLGLVSDFSFLAKIFFESYVGSVLAETDIPRADLFIQTKFASMPHQKPFVLPYPAYEGNDVTDACQVSLYRSLENLRTTYVDAFLINAPELTVTPTIALLRLLQKVKKEGKARYTGLCNVATVEILKHLHQSFPGVVQIIQNPLHSAWDPDYKIHRYCRDHGIQYNTFHTLTTSDRIVRGDTMRFISGDRSTTPVLNFLQYCVQSGITPLVGARSPDNLRSVMPIATGKVDLLSTDHMRSISRLMAEQTVINRYRSSMLHYRRMKKEKQDIIKEKLELNTKRLLLRSAAERENREQEIVQKAKERAKALADELRGEAKVKGAARKRETGNRLNQESDVSVKISAHDDDPDSVDDVPIAGVIVSEQAVVENTEGVDKDVRTNVEKLVGRDKRVDGDVGLHRRSQNVKRKDRAK